MTGLETYLIGGGAVFIVCPLTILKAVLWGASRERDKQAANQLDAIQKRKETDDEIASLGSADVDTRLKKWVRED